jgi:hypothetical protein
MGMKLQPIIPPYQRGIKGVVYIEVECETLKQSGYELLKKINGYIADLQNSQYQKPKPATITTNHQP